MKSNRVTPIAELGARAPEAGRIRMGILAPTKGGKTRPASIKTFRFTSPMQHLIIACAELFGGTVAAWNKQWEVVSNVDQIPVVLLPGGIGQDYELWSGGGCQRRCDGETVQVPTPVSDFDYEMRPYPCICAAKGQLECTAKTRLQVLIPSLPFAGVWRLETGGWNAAEELPGMYEMIVALGERGMVQAILSMEQREKVVTTGRGAQTRHFVVPRLSIAQTVHELASGGSHVGALGPATPTTQPALGPAAEIGTDTADEPNTGTERPDDDIVDGDIVTERQLEVEAELASCAEYFGLDEQRFIRAVGRTAKDDLDRMAKAAEKMRAGELAPLGFYPDGSIQWQM